MRAVRFVGQQRLRDRGQNVGNSIGQRSRQCRCAHLTLKLLLAHALSQLCRSGSTKIGTDQRILDLFKRGRINSLAPENSPQRSGNTGAGLAKAGFEFFKPAHPDAFQR